MKTSDDTVESEKPHGTNRPGLKLRDETNGAEIIKGEEWQKQGSRNSVLSLRDSKMTCTGIVAALLLHLPGNTSAKDFPKHSHKLLVIIEIVTVA